MVTDAQATLGDLYDAPKDGKYELVDGRLVHMSPTGLRPTRISQRICRALEDYEDETGSGIAVADNAGFVAHEPELRTFSPDVAFIQGVIEETDDFVHGMPIFAVAIRSKGDHTAKKGHEYAEKRAAYFAAGTHVVWDVNPRDRTITSYCADTPNEPRIFRAGDTADAEPALPGWRVSVAHLMP
jgi:Uma2 family endonuclease